MVDWDDTLSVGVSKIDAHNRQLILLSQHLHNALATRPLAETVRTQFADLLDYLVFHYACEEIWMIRSGYACAAEHEEEHKQLNQRVRDIYGSFLTHDTSVLRRFNCWTKLMIVHIKKEDAHFGRFLSESVSCLATLNLPDS